MSLEKIERKYRELNNPSLRQKHQDMKRYLRRQIYKKIISWAVFVIAFLNQDFFQPTYHIVITIISIIFFVFVIPTQIIIDIGRYFNFVRSL